MMRFEVDRRRHVIVGRVIATWSSWACSTAHPLIDEAYIRATTHDPKTGDVTAWGAGGIAIRLWPVRTSRRVRLLSVGVDGWPAWTRPARRRAIARQRAAQDRMWAATGDADRWVPPTSAHP